MLPLLSGRPVRVEVGRDLGLHHAATSIPERRVWLDAGVFKRRGEFERILVHELFHFVWVRLSNPVRREWEQCLAGEISASVGGELGWSAESRKDRIDATDIGSRTRRWRNYACESFCDTAAWMYAGIGRHPEFTLPSAARRARRSWFLQKFPDEDAVRF